MGSTPILELKNISKRFGGVLALSNVNFALLAGEVHCLVGENGAGKSTLVKIIAGACQKDSGEIRIHGNPVEIRNVHHSRTLGICEIYQELMLVPGLSVVENVFLGNEITSPVLGLMDWKPMIAKTQEKLLELGMDISPKSLVKDLSIAQQQMVEITKALVLETSILILDEPTGSLTPKNTEDLFRIIRRLKEKGVSIIYISHRLEEFEHIADRVTVLRDGRSIGTSLLRDTTIPEIIKLMVGRELTDSNYFPNYDRSSQPRIAVKDLCRIPKVNKLSFHVHAGEIVGFAGLVGAGRTELLRCIYGADKADSGEIYLDGQKISLRSTIDSVKQGLGLVPENRKDQGLVMNMSVRANVTLSHLKNYTYCGKVDLEKEKQAVEEQIKKLRIATPSTEHRVCHLSGGNQQKVILARWLAAKCRLLLLDEPTRGVDVGAKSEIYELMRSLAAQGVSIIMVSSDLPEILRMSDRILVMAKGSLSGELSRSEATQEKIMHLMLGGGSNVPKIN